MASARSEDLLYTVNATFLVLLVRDLLPKAGRAGRDITGSLTSSPSDRDPFDSQTNGSHFNYILVSNSNTGPVLCEKVR